MIIKSPEEVMTRFVEFINTADEQLADEVIAPEALFHAPTHPEPLRGPSGYLELLAMLRNGFSDIQWTMEETIIESDRVAARFTMRGTHSGEFFGVPPTGVTIAAQAFNFYYLAHGQIVGEHGQPDLLGILQQIGAVPAP